MVLETMYPPQKDSPSTFLTSDISHLDEIVNVSDASILPQIVPYSLTIGIDENITETVIVTAIQLQNGNNQLTISRGNPAYSWPAGTTVARVLTAQDIRDIQENIYILEEFYGGVETLYLDEVQRAISQEVFLENTKVAKSELPSVVTDVEYSANPTTVIQKTTNYNATTGQTFQNTRPLPVANETTMGVMPPEMYQGVEDLKNDVNALKNLGGRFIGLSFDTFAELTAYEVPETVHAGDYTYVVDDETKNNSITRYVYTVSGWSFTFIIEHDPIGTATTITEGIVKSTSNQNGKVFVELDGSMSVVGWDDLVNADKKLPIALIAEGTSNDILINCTSFSATAGEMLTFIATYNNNGQATLINNIPLYKPNTTTTPIIIAGKIYTVWYETLNGAHFFLRASTEGTAVAENVLAGKTFSNDIDTSVVGMLNVGEGSYAPKLVWVPRVQAADNSWKSVCYGNGIFVAVASNEVDNCVMTSPDGITWTSQNTQTFASWNSVCYGNGLFVAVASSGIGNRVMTSPDGITWTLRTSAADNNWNSVCYGNGLFVAVASSGVGNRIMTSPDGINWGSNISPADNSWTSVCYGNGMFVAVSGSQMEDNVMTSPDGITWTLRTSYTDSFWNSVCYGNGLFVAVGTTGIGYRLLMSYDGITWKPMTSPESNSWTSVCYGNGLFVAVSVDGSNRIITMKYWIEEVSDKNPTGILPLDPFVLRNSPVDRDWNSVCYGNGLFVAVASSGIGNRVMTSSDGITWTLRTSADDNNWNSVCYGNGLFVAVASSGTGNRVMTSSDGITWTLRTSAADNNWNSVCYGNGLFVAVASSGVGNRIMTSTDGITWTLRVSPADHSWTSVCYGKGMFVAVGLSYRVMTSIDGLIWEIESSPGDYSWTSVCYGNGLFVAVASSGAYRVMTSPDGITWILRYSVASLDWTSVCYGNGMFVAVAATGVGNRVITSLDGCIWKFESSAADINWNSVGYGNGRFVAVANSGSEKRVMTVDIVRQQLKGISKCILNLDIVTASYVSSTVITFDLKSLVIDYSIIRIENIITQFTNISMNITNKEVFLAWTYNNTTGILSCTASSSLFVDSFVTKAKAKIYIVM